MKETTSRNGGVGVQNEGGKGDESLSDYRKEIDEINRAILSLHEQRLEVVKKVSAYKQREGLPILQPTREEEVIREMCRSTLPEYAGGTKVLFETLMSISREFQYTEHYRDTELYERISSYHTGIPGKGMKTHEGAKLRIACQGVPGSYSTSGANEMFPGETIDYYQEFGDVFDAVQEGKAEIGVLPIENSFSGSVLPVYDLMKKHSFYIYRCQKVRVNHCLLGIPGANPEQLRTVYSHDQGLSQCSAYLREHSLEGKAYSNTAAAAKFVGERRDASVGAIASKECGQLYGLEVLAEGVQNREENYTRFIAITKDFYLPEQANKVSICLSTAHSEGSLHNLLTRFATSGLNLTKIESRPIENVNFAFLFFLEFEGNIQNENVTKLMCQLSEELDSFAFLGNYREE